MGILSRIRNLIRKIASKFQTQAAPQRLASRGLVLTGETVNGHPVVHRVGEEGLLVLVEHSATNRTLIPVKQYMGKGQWSTSKVQ